MAKEKLEPIPVHRTRPWFELALVTLFVLFICYVPVRRCGTCYGRGEVPRPALFDGSLTSQPIGGTGRTLQCRECGGPGRLTTYQVIYDLVASSAGMR